MYQGRMAEKNLVSDDGPVCNMYGKRVRGRRTWPVTGACIVIGSWPSSLPVSTVLVQAEPGKRSVKKKLLR